MVNQLSLPSSRLAASIALVAMALQAGCSAPSPTAPRSPAAGEQAPDEATTPQLHGRVVDPEGRPMAGVPVTLYGGFATRWGVGSTMTDADGRYAFDSLEGRGMSINNGRDTYVGVCVGEGLGNLNPAAYLPWTDVTIPAGEHLEHNVVLDLAEVQRRAEAERARK